ncbi:MAG: SAM-dependent methyltransferase [Deltaproteobacteria bacterium]|nr:SAM-dependent methyltransferase [Deltaproteobacteria bacterium]
MDQLPPSQQMFQHITGYWVTQLMGTASRLGLADRLEAGPQPVTELAAKVGANPDALYRLMRACTAVGVFVEQPGRTFANSPLSQTLRSNVPGSMRDFAIAQSSAGHWRPWERLEDAVKTGERTTVPVLGREIFEWYGNHPEEAAAFSGAMHNLAALVASELTKLIDLSKASRVVDVGGANGTLVSAVLRAFPQTQGVLFELPHVVASAKSALAAVGLAERCEAIAGDFFQSVPKGDVMLLKQVLHDWNDEQCVTLLKNCAASLPVGGRVLVVEMVVAEDGKPSPAHLMDINMLVMLPGRERTRSEYAKLLAAAGLEANRMHPTHSPFSIIEATKAR